MTKYKSFEENEEHANNEIDETNSNQDLDDDYELKKWCGVRRSTVLFVFYFVSYFAYLILGGYVMAMLETPHEINLKADVKKMKETFLQDNPHVNRSEFEQLLLKISELHSQGIGFSDSDLESNNWSIGQSLLFTVTVVTTVGNVFILHDKKYVMFVINVFCRIRSRGSYYTTRQSLLHLVRSIGTTVHSGLHVCLCSKTPGANHHDFSMVDVG